MTTKRENQLAVKGTVEKRVQDSKALLERMGITPEAYERVVLNALIRNPALQDCDRTSLDIAVADCIQAGLLPDGKQCAIVPFKAPSHGDPDDRGPADAGTAGNAGAGPAGAGGVPR